MVRIYKLAFITALSMVAVACADKPVEVAIDITANLKDKPLADAVILADGQEIGKTDAQGHALAKVQRLRNTKVAVTVKKDLKGFFIQPWERSFIVSEENKEKKYLFNVKLEGSPFMMVVAKNEGKPLEKAALSVNGVAVGNTNNKGEYVYQYDESSAKQVTLSVTKEGFSTWKLAIKPEPGKQLEAGLNKVLTVKVKVFTEQLNASVSLKDAIVTIDGSKVGNTNKDGEYRYNYDGAPGKKIKLDVSATGYVSAKSATEITLNGNKQFTTHLFSMRADLPRIGVTRIGANTAGEDIGALVETAQKELISNIQKQESFIIVPDDVINGAMKSAKLTLEKMTTKGWRNTLAQQTLEYLLVGSISKTKDEGIMFEAKVYDMDGKLVSSHLADASSAKKVDRAAKEIAVDMIDKFPFEGRITGKDDDRLVINLGTRPFDIDRNAEFTVALPQFGKDGKISSYKDVGSVKVKSNSREHSTVEINNISESGDTLMGARIIRQNGAGIDGDEIQLTVKGGVSGDVAPVRGVNVYVEKKWLGTTDKNGQLKMAIKLGKKYDLTLYKAGYEQLSQTLKAEKKGENKEFALNSYSSVLKVETEPTGAKIFVDGVEVGKTPETKGINVLVGFHTLTLAYGQDYRDWEQVVAFDKKDMNYTGSNKISIYKDFLKIGDRAETAGKVDEAIAAYKSAHKDHPDYAQAHNRLAQLYLDEKNDPDAALAEFETVAAIPEIKELVLKQFSVLYTNMGRAYYEKAELVIHNDPEGAAKYIAKAIQAIKKAKENSRFFPAESYDVALHDTYYYYALSYYKLYMVTKRKQLLHDADMAWREYFDFFPKSLEGNKDYEQSRQTAQRYWNQVQGQS
ncbi:MAG: PEGA domain-containing protein [Pseudomonadota bacterium]